MAMRNKKVVKFLSALLLFFIIVSGLTGCAVGSDREDLTITGFAFDTTYTITLYQGGSKEILNSCVERCGSYERVFSRTLETSELYQINEIGQIYREIVEADESLSGCWESVQEKKGAFRKKLYTQSETEKITNLLNQKKSEKNVVKFEVLEDGALLFQVSDMMRDIIQTGLTYCEASEGRFDITVEPVTSLWNFKNENPEVPGKEEILKALQYVGYQKISIEENQLKVMEPGVGIDLGGIAKGFIADDLKKYLVEKGVIGGTINLGGNVLCIGGKSKKEAFRIGIQQPFADRNQTIAAVEVRDLSVVSSGIYERYFETQKGVLYHHIINPKTGYSYENDLLGVTILSEKSVDGDALSTTCFALGKEEGLKYINSLDNVYALFITKDEKLWYSEGFKNFLLVQ